MLQSPATNESIHVHTIVVRRLGNMSGKNGFGMLEEFAQSGKTHWAHHMIKTNLPTVCIKIYMLKG